MGGCRLHGHVRGFASQQAHRHNVARSVLTCKLRPDQSVVGCRPPIAKLTLADAPLLGGRHNYLKGAPCLFWSHSCTLATSKLVQISEETPTSGAVLFSPA
jgi:hypothetical protein